MSYKVIGVELIDVLDHGSNVTVIYSQLFENGSSKIVRKNVKDLGGYYRFFEPKPVRTAECLGKVGIGFLNNDIRVLFAVRLTDGSAQLIQVKEGREEYIKLLSLCDLGL